MADAKRVAPAAQPASESTNPTPNPEDVGTGAKLVRCAHKGDTYDAGDRLIITGEWQEVPASKVKNLLKTAKRDRVHLRVTDKD